MDPLSAVTSGLQTIANLGSSIYTNKMNKKLVRETNALNYQMFGEQNEFNERLAKEMFDLENAYNDPSAVRERLENAGYNPFAMGEQGASFANGDVATPTAGTPIPMQAPQYQAPQFNFAETIGDLTLKAAQAKNLGANTETVDKTRDKIIKQYELDNATKSFELKLKKEFDYAMRTYQNEEQRARLAETYQNIQNKLQDYKNAIIEGDIKTIEKERASILKDMDSVRLKFLPKELKQQLENLVKQGGVLDSQASYNRAAAENQRAQASYTAAQQKTVDELREPLVTAQKTGYISNVVDILCKLVRTPAEVKEIEARTKNLSEQDKKLFVERLKTIIETGQSLFSASGKLDLPMVGEIGAGVQYGK